MRMRVTLLSQRSGALLELFGLNIIPAQNGVDLPGRCSEPDFYRNKT